MTGVGSLVPAGSRGRRGALTKSPRHQGRELEESLPQRAHRTQRKRFKMHYLERFVGFVICVANEFVGIRRSSRSSMPPAQSSPPTTTATTSSARADWWRMKPPALRNGLIESSFTTAFPRWERIPGQLEEGKRVGEPRKPWRHKRFYCGMAPAVT